MITYRIVFKNTEKLPVSQIEQPDPKSPDYSKHIFERALNRCTFKVGDNIKIRGTSKRGKVVDIVRDFNKINWDRNRPHFVTVEINGEIALANPAQLKRTGNK